MARGAPGARIPLTEAVSMDSVSAENGSSGGGSFTLRTIVLLGIAYFGVHNQAAQSVLPPAYGIASFVAVLAVWAALERFVRG